MTDATMMLTALHSAGAELWIESDRLRVRAPTGVLSPEWRTTLAAHRNAVLAALIAEADAWAMDRLDAMRGDHGVEPEPLPRTPGSSVSTACARPVAVDSSDRSQRATGPQDRSDGCPSGDANPVEVDV